MADQPRLQLDEFDLVEKPALDLFSRLGYNYLDGRKLKKEPQQFFLLDILKKKLREINPWIDDNKLNKAVREIMFVQAASLVEANKLLYYKLVNYTSLKQDRGSGRKSYTVKFIDFDEPEKNDFTVVNQFYVENNNAPITPDIVVFVNGIPLAVLECRSPNLQNPIKEAISRLFWYREINEQFFYTNQVLVGLARYRATYASTFSPAGHFLEWKMPYPLNERELASLLGNEGQELLSQDILLYSLFSKENFLDILRSYIVFENENNNIQKKICRYNQYIASNKILVRIAHGTGGVVWHTQGSGKSLTLTYTTLKIRRTGKVPGTSLENPCILILTDRDELDSQIAATFKNCNFLNVVQINSVEQLKAELKKPAGKTILATIQEFITKKGEIFPDLSSSSKIIVFVDEVQRSLYEKVRSGKTTANQNINPDWALNMRTAIPNALFIGFTGTPIDKNDTSTRREFGEYIHTYLPKQSIIDGGTLRIKYQVRLPEVHILGSQLDVAFNSEFGNNTDLEQETIKEKLRKYKTVAENEYRIKNICKDILEHYTTVVRPEGFKAQIVTPSKKAAVTYKKILDELGAPESEIVFSPNPIDDARTEIQKYDLTKAQQRTIISKFKKPFDEDNKLAFLIVYDMLLTGFDAPIEQVMYLDKLLSEQDLMQAVTRVNRPYNENKAYGLIIDYCGIFRYLKETLEIFTEEDIAGYLKQLIDDVPKSDT